MIATQSWEDPLSAADALALRRNLTAISRPVLLDLAGRPSSESYSNEGDILEPNPPGHVLRLELCPPTMKSIKTIYDPNDLFIVPNGVSSEYWDAGGT